MIVEINAHEIIPKIWTRELKDDEVLCDKCKGLKAWFADGYMHWCNECNIGIKKLCQYCKQPLKLSSKCDCKDAEEERVKQAEEREQNRFNKATKINLDDYKNEMVFIEQLDKYVFVDDLDDILEDYKLDNDDEDIKDINYVYGCTPDSITFDADRIIEYAEEDKQCEDYDNCISKESKKKKNRKVVRRN